MEDKRLDEAEDIREQARDRGLPDDAPLAEPEPTERGAGKVRVHPELVDVDPDDAEL